MSRYYYYLILINTISNCLIYLPKVLTHERLNGAAIAIFLAIPFGALMLYLFTGSLKKFKGASMPEILKSYFPRWAQILIMVFFGPGWYISGVIMLSSAVDISKLMINPQMSTFWILAILVSLFIFVIRYQSKTILWGLEMFVIGFIGVLIFIYVRSLVNVNFNWDSVMVIEKQSLSLPTIFSFAITTYSFSGSIDMVTYNKSFPAKLQFKYLWLLPILILIFMLVSIIVPIGLLGSEVAGRYAYPLITATDTLSLKTGVIDRIFIIFLVVYLLIAILNIIVHWKVSFDLIRGLSQHQFNQIKIPDWAILLIFAIIPFIIKFLLNDQEIFILGEYWLTIRIGFEICIILIYIYAAHSRDKKANGAVKESSS